MPISEKPGSSSWPRELKLQEVEKDSSSDDDEDDEEYYDDDYYDDDDDSDGDWVRILQG